MSDFTKQYTDLLAIQYYNKPKALSTIELMAGEYEKLFNIFNDVETGFDLDVAVGKQLDIIGKIVGINRKVNGVIPKKYFGFSGTLNSLTFGMAPFVKLSSNKYSDYQLNDSDYRVFIKAKVIKNFAKGKISNIQSSIDYLFDSKGYISDNRDMTLTLWIDDKFNFDRIRLIEMLDLYPFPNGIGVKAVISYSKDGTFGFKNNKNAKTFGFGKFAKII